jgi:hypothetical protein
MLRRGKRRRREGREKLQRKSPGQRRRYQG